MGVRFCRGKMGRLLPVEVRAGESSDPALQVPILLVLRDKCMLMHCLCHRTDYTQHFLYDSMTTVHSRSFTDDHTRPCIAAANNKN